MNQLSYYVTKRLIVGSKDSSGTIIQKEFMKLGWQLDGNEAGMKVDWMELKPQVSIFLFQPKRQQKKKETASGIQHKK